MPTVGDFEPQVGEIRAVRTFRVGPGGLLFPLFSRRPWVAGGNEAACSAAPAPGRPGTHVPPDPDCTCGFYAYADLPAAGEYPYARHVLAVVSCWGRVIVATKGVRAQYARIEAIWLSDSVPADLARQVGERYSESTVYAERDAMLAAHAPTLLDDYESERLNGSSRRSWTRLVIGFALAAGLLPVAWTSRLPYFWVAWAVILSVLLGVGLRPHRRRPDAVLQRRRLVCVALALWMIAPFAGPAGVLFLHLPLLQITLLITVQRVAMARMARTFPAQIV